MGVCFVFAVAFAFVLGMGPRLAPGLGLYICVDDALAFQEASNNRGIDSGFITQSTHPHQCTLFADWLPTAESFSAGTAPHHHGAVAAGILDAAVVSARSLEIVHQRTELGKDLAVACTQRFFVGRCLCLLRGG